MQAVDTITPQVARDIERVLANPSATQLFIVVNANEHPDSRQHPPPLTKTDARSIVACLRENPRLQTLDAEGYNLSASISGNDTVLNILRHGLVQCTSLTTVKLTRMNLGMSGLQRLLPAFCNTSVTTLQIGRNGIQQGDDSSSSSSNSNSGGELILRELLVRNQTLLELNLSLNYIGRRGAMGLWQGLACSDCSLVKLNLSTCNIGNAGLAHLLSAFAISNTGGDSDSGNSGEMHIKNTTLTDLDLSWNGIQGEDGGRYMAFLLTHFPHLQVLCLDDNPGLGPAGAAALAPALANAASSHLETLGLRNCNLGNAGVKNLVFIGNTVTKNDTGQQRQYVFRSLTHLKIRNNQITGGAEGGEHVVALVSCCPNLDRITVDEMAVSADQQRRLNLLLDGKRLYTEAQALGGSSFSVVFEKLMQVNAHEHGLSAVFIILRDYIFAEQHKSREHVGNNEQTVIVQETTGIKRKL